VNRAPPGKPAGGAFFFFAAHRTGKFFESFPQYGKFSPNCRCDMMVLDLIALRQFLPAETMKQTLPANSPAILQMSDEHELERLMAAVLASLSSLGFAQATTTCSVTDACAVK
jgi:hypothetical protein